MFQHILFPTDGSTLSRTAADACIRFAGQVGARVTFVHVVPPLHLFTYEPIVTDKVHEAYRRNREQSVQEYLAPLQQAARDANVPCTALLAEADEPYEAILSNAHDQLCDLIMMASHGRTGIRAVLLGSQTQKVLTHSAIPVMVYKSGDAGAGIPLT